MKIVLSLRSVVMVALGLMCLSIPVKAQQWAVYALGNGSDLRVQDTNYVYGGTFGVYHMKQFSGLVSVGPDVRVTLMSHGNFSGQYTDARQDLGTFGLRVGFSPHKLVPYGEAMVGFGYWRGGIGLTRQDQYSSVLEGLAGVDYAIKPKIDWRVVEFSYSRLSGQIHSINPVGISTGVVFRIP